MTADPRYHLPFDQVNALLLSNFQTYLEEMFPNGVKKGSRFLVGDLEGNAGESLSINLRTGEWGDFNPQAGTPGGYDPISLYAAKFYGRDRIVTVKALGVKFGLMDPRPGRSAEIVPLRPVTETKTVPAKKPKEEWLPEVPPPGDAPPPDLSKYDHNFPHYSEHGELLRYMVRNDAKGDKPKVVYPLTYGTLNGVRGWHLKKALEPRHPYGLDRAAKFPDATIWITFGELKADDLYGVFVDRPVMTWTFGDSSVHLNDWTYISGRKVIIWPDVGAEQTAEKLSKILLDHECQVWVIDVSGQPDKWDAGNAIRDDKWTAEQIDKWVKPRLRVRRKEAPATEAKPKPDDKPKAAPRPAARGGADQLNVGTDKHGVVPLGHNHGQYFYYSKGRKQVVTLSAASHKKLELMSLASVPHYWERTKFAGEKGVAWDSVAAHLMDLCHAVGVFDPARIRGRGAWLDAGRSVLHLGDRLLVDGEERDLFLDGSKYVYENAVPLSQAIAAPLTAEEASAVLDIFKKFEWDREINGRLAAGWVAIAPVCGALAWRPSIWLTGPSGSGKSTLTSVIALCLGGMALNVQSKTSEAGIRQSLGSDALPVTFDEAEGEDRISKARLQAVFDLVRQSSSEGGAEIVKGTANQSGAKKYRIRSCFLFSSINVSLENQADENRITVLALKTPPRKGDQTTTDDRDERWKAFNKEFTATLTPEFCAGLIARSVRMAPIIRQSAEVFATVIGKHLGNRRAGDQLGALLAGAHALEYDDVVSVEYAETWISKNAPKLDAADTDIEPDEQRLLNFLMQVRVTVRGGNGHSYDRTIGEIIAAARASTEDRDLLPQDYARSELLRCGIKYKQVEKDGDIEGIYIANKHSVLARWLEDTPWSAQWGRSLERLPGAHKSMASERFAHGVVQRAVLIPITVVLP